ncbi:oxaloacetate decarboxylase subunit alpha [uncultured Eubacterium sp.]|uniref:oxaloacetate decarboxylase subunit alpha n=1 Tax=uncultured Eubacterium sp. TaxID=165185 RepID=UPI0015AEBC68|nr:oxaloacetate decarboxylase subunit alpha [uncultured Eubacterium sp.]
MGKKSVKIVETVLRDAHQSLIATRMPIEKMLPIVDTMDQVGYHAVECWGGATFDACLRFLNEDPWDRLKKLKDGFKNTKLQMLFRGQNILGYRPYADDVVEYFVQKSVANGIDIIRIFDCLNDLRNLETSIKAANKEKAHAQVALSYTLGDAYTLEYWVGKAKQIEQMGADSICIKDMAGLLLPYEASVLVKALKENTNLPVELHTHYTSGVASMTYLKAVEAGVDIIDCAISPFALGTSQPATEVMVETFRGTPYDTGYDQKKLAEIADYFRPYRDECLQNGLLNPKNLGVDIKTLLYQVPGGMLSNLTSQLKEQNAEDKFYDVLEEVPRVRKDLGEVPLVTPSSQIVGTQAVFNVLFGKRYMMVTKETKDLLAGKYGATVKPVDPELKKKVLQGEEGITCRPADLLDNELDKLQEEVQEYKEKDEDVLSYALFPQVAMDFFKKREKKKGPVQKPVLDFEIDNQVEEDVVPVLLSAVAHTIERG